MDQNDRPSAVDLTSWRHDPERPARLRAVGLRRAAAKALAGRPELAALRQALDADPFDAEAVGEIVACAGDGSTERHDAAMTLVSLTAWDRDCAAQVIAEQLSVAARNEMPGTPAWQRLVRLVAQWQRRCPPNADTGIPFFLDRLNTPDADAASPPAAVEPATEEVPASLGDIAAAERHVSVLDQISPRNSEKMADIEAFGALIQGLPLRRFDEPISRIIAILREEFPWFDPLIDAIEAEWRLSAASARDWVWVRPMLIHGPPGIGKSRFIARLAELAGVGHGFLSVAGASDNRALLGTSSGYATASPSWPAHMFLKLRCANPVLMIDEIDKTSEERRNGRVIDALLTMIEPVTARMWNDDCLGGALDLRHVSWLLCANDISRVDETLRSRTRCVAIDLPEADHYPQIMRAIARDVAGDYGMDPPLLPQLDDKVAQALADGFARTRSIRRLRRAYEVALGQQLGMESVMPN
jgi:hypothetical protein